MTTRVVVATYFLLGAAALAQAPSGEEDQPATPPPAPRSDGAP